MQSLNDESLFEFECPVCKRNSVKITFGELMNESKDKLEVNCSTISCKGMATIDANKFRKNFLESLGAAGINVTKK